ncbi:hypothetical protein CJ030_MR3G015764 [Morella rubra]|uniref:Uncharacterized protein n=1 Tax=Morella rubra TaxID=262757 RepID=A0A6A1W5M8_9ROSI|nr:hypothetical protein CJ030_MR3G015764 [Morella rubra]
MSSMVSNTQSPADPNGENITDKTTTIDIEATQNPHISRLYIKSTNSAQPLDREVVLRRIRQRKRVNKIKSTLQALFGLPFSGKPEKVSAHEKRWVDDAFAAL